MNREQFISLVNGEQEKLRRFLLALCLGDRDEADDIAQEALMKAYLSSSGYQDKGKFTAWLYKIARNTFLDHKKCSRSNQPIDDATLMPDNRFAADRNFKYQDLYSALSTLTETERTPILLFYINGYSVKEIAEITESKPEAVKMRLSRGREHLRQILKDDGER